MCELGTELPISKSLSASLLRPEAGGEENHPSHQGTLSEPKTCSSLPTVLHLQSWPLKLWCSEATSPVSLRQPLSYSRDVPQVPSYQFAPQGLKNKDPHPWGNDTGLRDTFLPGVPVPGLQVANLAASMNIFIFLSSKLLYIPQQPAQLSPFTPFSPTTPFHALVSSLFPRPL